MFDLIDYNITDAVVTFEEGVYAENVMTKSEWTPPNMVSLSYRSA